MAPHALLASRSILDMDEPELGVLYAINPMTGGLISPMGAAPPHDDSPKLEGYVVAGTVVSVCLAVCLVAVVIVVFYLCIKKRLRIRGEAAARYRPPTPMARVRARASSDEETEDPPIPLATLPAAQIAGKRPPANTAAQRPGFLSGMEVARPLQVPFLDTVVEATSSEERVCRAAGDAVDEDAGDHLDEDAYGALDEVKTRGGL